MRECQGRSLLQKPRTTSFDVADLIARFHARDATIAVVGMGYVGIPLALTATAAGSACWGWISTPTESPASMMARA